MIKRKNRQKEFIPRSAPLEERLILTYSPKFQKILNTGKKQIQKTGGIRHEDFWREVDAESN